MPLYGITITRKPRRPAKEETFQDMMPQAEHPLDAAMRRPPDAGELAAARAAGSTLPIYQQQPTRVDAMANPRSYQMPVGGGFASVMPGSQEEGWWQNVRRGEQQRSQSAIDAMLSQAGPPSPDDMSTLDSLAGMRDRGEGGNERARHAAESQRRVRGTVPGGGTYETTPEQLAGSIYGESLFHNNAYDRAAQTGQGQYVTGPAGGTQLILPPMRDLEAGRMDLSTNNASVTRGDLDAGRAEGLDANAVQRYGLEGARQNRVDMLRRKAGDNPSKLMQLIVQTGARPETFEDITGKSWEQHVKDTTPDPESFDEMMKRYGGDVASKVYAEQQDSQRTAAKITADMQTAEAARTAAEEMARENRRSEAEQRKLDRESRAASAALDRDLRRELSGSGLDKAVVDGMVNVFKSEMGVTEKRTEWTKGAWYDPWGDDVEVPETQQERVARASEVAKKFAAMVKALPKDRQSQVDFSRIGQPGYDEVGAPVASGAPVPITSDAEYEALPSGTVFTDPEGVNRRKP